jgi:LysR family transcriptional activator of nhaA
VIVLDNYKHLHYFWLVTKEAGMASVSERLSITLQTIGAHIILLDTHFGTALFQKVGRYIKLTATGRLVLIFADEIFSLDSELERLMHHLPDSRPKQFGIGGADVLSKSISQTNELKK